MADKGISLLSCMHRCNDCSDAVSADDGHQTAELHAYM